MKKILLILSLVFSIGIVRAQSLHLDSMTFNYQPQFWGFPDSLQGFGHSIMFGTNGDAVTVIDSAFFYLFYRGIADSGYNHGIGGSGAIDALMQSYRYVSNPHRAMVLVLSGRNELVGTVTGGTYNKIINSDKAMFANVNIKNWVSARTSTFVTKFGTWSDYTNIATGGYFETKSQQGTKTSTNNDSITYDFVFPDSTLIITMIGSNTGYSTFQVFIDGVSQGSFNTNGATDAPNTHDININRGATAVCPMSFFFTGLSFATHHVKVVNTSAAILAVDYFGHLIDSRFSYPFFLMNDIAYGGGGSSDTLVHSNLKLDSLVATLPPGYRAYSFHTNDYWTQATDIGTDGIHPNNRGYRHIDTGILAVTVPFFPNTHFFTLTATGGGLYGRTVRGVYPYNMRRMATMADVSNLFLPLTFPFNQTITNPGKYNLTLSGSGPTGGNGVGASINSPNLSITDSSFTYLRVKPSGEGSVPMGVQGRDWTGGTYSVGFGSNSSNIFPGINNTRQGGAFFFDSRTASGNPVSILVATKPPTVTTDVTAGRIFSDGRWTFGDTAAAGNAVAYFFGTGQIRIPGGTTAQRLTGQGGSFRMNTDSTGGLGVTHPEIFDGTAWHSLLYNGEGGGGGGGTPGGATTNIQYNNAGAFGGSANHTWDNTNFIDAVTVASTANTVFPAFKGLNAGTASAANQMYGGFYTSEGAGWKTTATAASQAVAYQWGTVPVQGAANPSGNFVLQSNINGAGYNTNMTVTSAGEVIARPMTNLSTVVQGFVVHSQAGAELGSFRASTTSGEARLAAAASYFITLNPNATELMRLVSAGRVLIGSSTDNTTGKLQVTSTTEQLALHYDATHKADFTVGSAGQLTIAPTLGQYVDFNGGFSIRQTNGSISFASLTIGTGAGGWNFGYQNGGVYVNGNLAIDSFNTVTFPAGIRRNVVSKTTTYSILTTDFTINCTSGTFTATLPDPTNIGGQIFIVKNSGVGTITVGTASGTIDGSATASVLTTAVKTFQSIGSTGYIIIGN